MTPSSVTYPDDSLHPERLKSTFETISEHQIRASTDHEAFAVDSSREIVPITESLFEGEHAIDIELINDGSSVSERELLRIRKVSEVYEDQWRFRLPSGAIWRAAQTLGTITTIGGILVALKGIHKASSSIKSTYTAKGRTAIEDEQITDFYFASGVFFGELVLMTTPLSTNFAFQATGRLHSYVLWHRFHNHRGIYRLLLHHLYYILSGIPSLALHGLGSASERVEWFVDSIIFLIKTSWDVFETPSFLSDLISIDPSDGLIGRLTDLSLGDIQSELGAGYEDLRDYIYDILDTLEEHYQALYEHHLETPPREIVKKVITRLPTVF